MYTYTHTLVQLLRLAEGDAGDHRDAAARGVEVLREPGAESAPRRGANPIRILNPKP